MTALVWGETGSKLWRTGVSRGALYVPDHIGVAWDGLVSVTENVSGGELESYYFDGRKYMDVILTEDYQATIEAFSAPEEFLQCDGSRSLALGLYVTGQPRIPFGFAWQNIIGNDVDGVDHGYELHLVWGCTASPSESAHTTVNDSPELMVKSWQINSVPPVASSYKPNAHFVIYSTAGNYNLVNLLDDLYGTEESDPYLPTQQEVIDILEFTSG